MLLPYDDPLLRKKMEYKEVTQEQREGAHKMLIELCTKLRGVGLSANQVGIDNRVFCVKMADYEETFFNPVIVEESEKTTLFKEGCLSQPGVFITLKRPETITLEYISLDGEKKRVKYSGITARIIQHEYDHMEGRNFLDLASPIKRALALKQAKKKYPR